MQSSSEFEPLLRAAGQTDDRAERTLRLAAVLSGALRAAGARPVLVGGGAVEIYTRSAYTTRDLDFVAAVTEEVANTMIELRFEREGRHWVHTELGIVVEFPATVLAPARDVAIDVDGLELRIITIEDLIVDRLASWKHWGWDPDGAAAAILLAGHPDLDRRRLRQRAFDEDVGDALEGVTKLVEAGKRATDAALRRARKELTARED